MVTMSKAHVSHCHFTGRLFLLYTGAGEGSIGMDRNFTRCTNVSHRDQAMAIKQTHGN